MADQFEVFAATYRDLVETACEWRAFQLDDPVAMADRVFDGLRRDAAPPSLRRTFQLIQDAVDQAYRRQHDQRSLTQGLMQGMAQSWLWRPNAGGTDPALTALGRLSYADGATLRQVLWDGLSFDELADINRGDAERQRRRYTTALAHFAARLPAGTTEDPAAIMRRLQPGSHRRAAAPADTADDTGSV